MGVVMGRESFHEFLGRCEPTYRVGRWVARNLPATARLIGQDHRGFYIPRGYTMELAHRRRTGLGRNGESPARSSNTLKKEGFTHLMLCPPVAETAVEFDPTLGRLLAPWLAGHDAALSRGPGRRRRRRAHAMRSTTCWTNDWAPVKRERDAMTAIVSDPGRAADDRPERTPPRDRQLAGPARGAGRRPSTGPGWRSASGSRLTRSPWPRWPPASVAAAWRSAPARAWDSCSACHWRTWPSGSTTSTARSLAGAARRASTGSIFDYLMHHR